MARSLACCLVFMALFGSLLVHPALAKGKKKHIIANLNAKPVFMSQGLEHPATSNPNPNPNPAMSTPPTMPPTMPPVEIASGPALAPAVKAAAGSLAMIVASQGQDEKSFTKHICELAANPETCDKILEHSDKEEYMKTLTPGAATKLSLELSAAVAAKGVVYMNEKLTEDKLLRREKKCVNNCIANYQESILAFNGAYVNMTIDSVNAISSLNLADTKISLCASNITRFHVNSIPRVEESNKLLRELVVVLSQEMPKDVTPPEKTPQH